MKIYVPDNTSYKCFVVRDETTIRAYKEVPRKNSDIEYRDYFYNSNYLYQDGEQSFGNYSVLPVCLDNSVITTDFYYRNDLPSILFIFFIFSLFCIYIPLKLFMRLFRRFN